jgi:enoyl-CoA hydratase
MSTGHVHLSIDNHVAAILIDRPEARNAMTWAMYDTLGKICTEIAGNPQIRVATIRGAGGEAFVAGTDIEQFRSFDSGEDGIRYEQTIDAMIARIERLPVPTLAIVEGWAIGGGLAIAAACDFRIATPTASFGVPIARTLGNCLSMANNAEAAALDERAAAICARLAANAPATMRASKEAIRRLVGDGLPNGEDLVRLCYGSRDFKIGVEAFMEKKRPVWTGA